MDVVVAIQFGFCVYDFVLHWSEHIYIYHVVVVQFLSTMNSMYKFIRLGQVCNIQNEVNINLISILFAHLWFVQATYILFSNFDWQIRSRLILISYLSIWAASECTNGYIVVVCQKLACKIKISVHLFKFFRCGGREPDRGDKVGKMDRYLFDSYLYYYTHGYIRLLSAIQSMCPMITLGLIITCT